MSELPHIPPLERPDEPSGVINMRDFIDNLSISALLARNHKRLVSDAAVVLAHLKYERSLQGAPTEVFPAIQLDPVRQDTTIQDADEWIGDEQ